MSEKLEPCPFCGGVADLVALLIPTSRRANEKPSRRYFARCIQCRAETSASHDKGRSIAAWNRRAARAEARPAPVGLHPATADLVNRFAHALAEKLAKAEQKYGYSDGWARDDWQDECRRQLHHHAAKGDPRDVAAYAAFCWHHGWSTARPAPVVDREAVARFVESIAAAMQDLPSDGALDEAFIWETPIERRPLITFGDLRRLASAINHHP